MYSSVRECARSIGGDYSTIYRCLNDLRHTHKGYTFEYVDER